MKSQRLILANDRPTGKIRYVDASDYGAAPGAASQLDLVSPNAGSKFSSNRFDPVFPNVRGLGARAASKQWPW